MFPHGETVVRHPWMEGADDGYGISGAWGPDETWAGVAVAPGSSSEPLADGSTRVITSMALYDSMAREVGPRDEFTVRGRRWAVDADGSGAWRSPWTGWTPGSVVQLRAVTGG